MRTILRSTVCGLLFILVLVPLLDALTPRQWSLITTATAAPLPQNLTDDTQTPNLFLQELQIIYLTNLKRREHGLPPLRWNRELHRAARWFAEDAVTAHAGQSYCGHTDAQNRSPGDRFLAFGYHNPHAWGENVICGLTDPAYAVEGWMNSEGHRANLLHAEYREIGVGYFQEGTSGRGYIVQDFSYDPTYAPVIINNEAPSTTDPNVTLYIYDPAEGEGLQGMGAAVTMRIANNPDFTDAAWEPYASEKSWQLPAGEGWRRVYVQTRDEQGRTSTVQDTIYLGATMPLNELDLQQACTYRPQLSIGSLEQTGWPQVQLSLSWLGDNSDSTFQDTDNIGHTIADPDAVAQNAYFIGASDKTGHVRYWTTAFHKDVPLVAYFRVKATNVTTSDTVLEISIRGGGREYGPLVLTGTDFVDGSSYREFALPFEFIKSDDPYLTFNFKHTGVSDVYLDTISIFTESMPIAEQMEWPVLGGYHRSRGIWARFINADGAFTAPADLQIFGANAGIAIPPIDGVEPVDLSQPLVNPDQLAHQLFLPMTTR